MMSFLSYKVLRGTCLRFPEQLQVVVAGDVLQQRLPARPVALAVVLMVGREREGEEREDGSTGDVLFFFLLEAGGPWDAREDLAPSQCAFPSAPCLGWSSASS